MRQTHAGCPTQSAHHAQPAERPYFACVRRQEQPSSECMTNGHLLPAPTHAPRPCRASTAPCPGQPAARRSRLFHKESKFIYLSPVPAAGRCNSKAQSIHYIASRGEGRTLHGTLGPGERTLERSGQSFSKLGRGTSSSSTPGTHQTHTFRGSGKMAEQAAQGLPPAGPTPALAGSVRCNYSETRSLPKGCGPRGGLDGELQIAVVSPRSEHRSGQHAALGARVGRKDPILQGLGGL